MTEHELARMVRQHLASLHAAGVEWLPRAPKLRPVPLGDSAPVAKISKPTETPALPTEPCTKETLAQRRTELQVLATSVSGCMRCPELVVSRSRTVFGVGNPNVELCIVGEAPGADEDAQGEPFVGAAGQLLDRILAACGFKREEVYICNSLKCRPPGNRAPTADEIANCRGYLEQQLDLVKPKFICSMGGSAAKSLLATTASLGSLRRRFHDYRGIPVLCTYHPAYLLPHRHPEKKKEVWEDMKMLVARMGRSVGNP